MDDKTRELLEVLATKLGAKTTELGEHAVNYTLICGWTGMIFSGILLLAGLALGVWGIIVFRRPNARYPGMWSRLEVAGALWAASVFCLIMSGSIFGTTLPSVLEPIGATISGLR